MTLVHLPLSPVGTVNPNIIDPDQLARAHARREVKLLNPDLVILRARRMAARALPEVASLPCGCHVDGLCAEAATLYLSGNRAFGAHRKPLYPRTSTVLMRLTAEGRRLAHEAQQRDGNVNINVNVYAGGEIR